MAENLHGDIADFSNFFAEFLIFKVNLNFSHIAMYFLIPELAVLAFAKRATVISENTQYYCHHFHYIIN